MSSANAEPAVSPHIPPSSLRFRSKVDSWFIGVVLFVVLVPLSIVVSVVAAGDGWRALLVPVVIMVVGAGLPLWMLADTSYTITDDELLVRCGPVRRRVPLGAITALTPTRTLLSSPALSLDRIEVCAGSHSVVVSPLDKQGFAAAIQRAIPTVRAGSSVDNSSAKLMSGLLLVAPMVYLAVFALIGVGVYMGSGAPEASLSSSALMVASRAVPLESIVNVTLEEALPRGLRKSKGLGIGKVLRGRFSLGQADKGDVFANRHGPPYVFVRTRGDFLLFNLESPAETRTFYGELAQRWKQTAP